MMGKKILIFGGGTFAQMVRRYASRLAGWEVVSFVVDAQYKTADELDGLPLISMETALRLYSPTDFDALVAVGYKGMSNGRKNAYMRLKEAGYSLPNLIHPSAFVECDEIGEGNIILEQCDICFGTRMGCCNLFWGGAMLSHDTVVGSFNTFARADFGGFCTVGNNCFFGLNSTIKDRVTIADYTFVGPNCYVSKDTKVQSVYIERGTKPVVGLSSMEVL